MDGFNSKDPRYGKWQNRRQISCFQIAFNQLQSPCDLRCLPALCHQHIFWLLADAVHGNSLCHSCTGCTAFRSKDQISGCLILIHSFCVGMEEPMKEMLSHGLMVMTMIVRESHKLNSIEMGKVAPTLDLRSTLTGVRPMTVRWIHWMRVVEPGHLRLSFDKVVDAVADVMSRMCQLFLCRTLRSWYRSLAEDIA